VRTIPQATQRQNDFRKSHLFRCLSLSSCYRGQISPSPCGPQFTGWVSIATFLNVFSCIVLEYKYRDIWLCKSSQVFNPSRDGSQTALWRNHFSSSIPQAVKHLSMMTRVSIQLRSGTEDGFGGRRSLTPSNNRGAPVVNNHAHCAG